MGSHIVVGGAVGKELTTLILKDSLTFDTQNPLVPSWNCFVEWTEFIMPLFVPSCFIGLYLGSFGGGYIVFISVWNLASMQNSSHAVRKVPRLEAVYWDWRITVCDFSFRDTDWDGCSYVLDVTRKSTLVLIIRADWKWLGKMSQWKISETEKGSKLLLDQVPIFAFLSSWHGSQRPRLEMIRNFRCNETKWSLLARMLS